MKIFTFGLKLSLVISWILVAADPAVTQQGNQSDSFPNVIENTTIITPQPIETINPANKPSENRPNTATNEVDRAGLEAKVEQLDIASAIVTFEQALAIEFSNRLDLQLYGTAPTSSEISKELCNLYIATGKKAALIYVMSLENKIETITIFPEDTRSPVPRCKADNESAVRKFTPEAYRTILGKVLQEFRNEITNPRKRYSTSYLSSAQKLYQWIVAPIESELQANKVETLVFAMDSGLRSTAIAALHDGQQFLVEKYGIALVPSFGLTNTRFLDVRNSQVLATGASLFLDQEPLPAVPIELSNIVGDSWRGKKILNEEFTIENFKSLNRQQHFGIIHLATHGEFQAGKLSNSYIQFWNAKLSLDRLREVALDLGWTGSNADPVELMVLSACRSAVGDEQAEYGFAGLAVLMGVKSALASLWYVSDMGTLGLMNEFYKQLKLIPNKAEALRLAQIAMLKGQIRIESGKMYWGDRSPVELPGELMNAKIDLSHPYFWSAFTLIGNWN